MTGVKTNSLDKTMNQQNMRLVGDKIRQATNPANKITARVAKKYVRKTVVDKLNVAVGRDSDKSAHCRTDTHRTTVQFRLL